MTTPVSLNFRQEATYGTYLAPNRAFEFDDEDLDPQLEQFVESGGVHIGGPQAAQRDRHKPSTRVPHSHTSVNSPGSSDSRAPSDGIISLSLGCQAVA